MKYPRVLEAQREKVEEALKSAVAGCAGPKPLLEAMAYSLLAGGKRVRPVLLLATAGVFPPASLDPMPTACALEFIHTYSLIHDDLPPMDNDDYRRGKLTSHKKFGEALAILAGDALLTEAFGLIVRSYPDEGGRLAAELIAELSAAAGADGMVGGQVLDMLDRGPPLAREELERVHRMKTGALIVAAVRCGAILCRAGEPERLALDRYAQRIGLAFQVADDYLDVVGSKEQLGKSVQKDETRKKTTFSSLLGLQASRDYARVLAEEAKRELLVFGESAEALRSMAEFIVERTI